MIHVFSKKTIALVLTFAMLIALASALSVYHPVQAVTQSEINELREKRNELRQQAQTIKDKISSLEYEQMSTMAKKEALDEQAMITASDIDQTEELIAAYDQYIAEKQEQVVQAQAEEDAQWDLYKTRIRAMEEQGVIQYISVIFQSSSFADLLSRLDVTNRIMQNDQRLYEELDEARKNTIKAKEDLELAQQEQREQKAELEEKKAELEKQIEEANELIAQIASNKDEQESLLHEAELDDVELSNMINELSAKLWAEQEAARKAEEARRRAEEANNNSSSSSGSGDSAVSGSTSSTVTGSGSIRWPCDATYVTSGFYQRYHPVLHYTRSHNGIDIGASYGSTVYAADSGTVVYSDSYGSYGYCIIIDHGNGMKTLYAHLSYLKASNGTTVNKGDVIAQSGSSGLVTGPHLHFEVIENGTRVNPLNYFSSSQYTLSPTAYE